MQRPPTLELSWLRTFVTAADARSFTAAGLALGATQSAISVRVRKLERRLGQRLLERNARSVILTPSGSAFLPDARRLLEMHDDAALRALGTSRGEVYDLGVSDHAAGQLLPQLLAPLRELADGRQLRVTVGISRELISSFERGRFDAVIGRTDDVGGDGQTLFEDRLTWMASDTFRWDHATPLPLVSLGPPCGIRDIVLSTLASHGIAWHATFIGTGVAAIQAAVAAGFGIACLEARNMPAGCRILNHKSRLPALPTTRTVIRFRRETDKNAATAREIEAVLKAAKRTRR
jgi:DNA-binding transcriptional LysR family regulator